MGIETMRKSLVVLALGGAVLMANSGAKALVGADATLIPIVTAPAAVQEVQYRPYRHHHHRYYDRRRRRYYYR
jgi:hypothetical protein